MAKDPAFLFYFQDFLVGTDDMSLQEIGAYIRCLCHQASKGSLSESHMRKICERQEVYTAIAHKFLRDNEGKMYNERLRLEFEKRKAFSDSRRLNRSKPNKDKSHMSLTRETYVTHMENEIENEDVIEIVNETADEKPKRAKFQKPGYPEVLQFMKNANAVAGGRWNEVKVVTEAKNYFNYYEANGWRVGRNPMKDWNAACRKWMNNADNFNNNGTRQKQSDELDAFRKHNANRVGQALGIVPGSDGNGPA